MSFSQGVPGLACTTSADQEHLMSLVKFIEGLGVFHPSPRVTCFLTATVSGDISEALSL